MRAVDVRLRPCFHWPHNMQPIDAIGRICKHRSAVVNTSEILPTWISWLPLRDDDDCARVCHAYLADLIEVRSSSGLSAPWHLRVCTCF